MVAVGPVVGVGKGRVAVAAMVAVAGIGLAVPGAVGGIVALIAGVFTAALGTPALHALKPMLTRSAKSAIHARRVDIALSPS